MLASVKGDAVSLKGVQNQVSQRGRVEKLEVGASKKTFSEKLRGGSGSSGGRHSERGDGSDGAKVDGGSDSGWRAWERRRSAQRKMSPLR